MIRMETKIDVHGIEEKYERTIRKFEADETIDPKVRSLIMQFISDCRMGKTLKGRAKKKIGKKRILKYLYALKKLHLWLGKPFQDATQKDLEKLVFDLEENLFKRKDGKNFAEETKLDFKKSLKKLYKWLGKQEMVEFMDMSLKQTEVPAISRKEAEQLINSTSSFMFKALIMVIFDGGARAEELLNLRVKDYIKKTMPNGQETPWINIRYSKTFERMIPIPLSGRLLDIWMDEHPEPENSEAPLFPIKYPVLRNRLIKLAREVLKKRVTLHMLRHSSATFWATKLSRYQMCAKYGWSFSSDMPDRYIKRKGIIFDEVAEKGDSDQLMKVEKEKQELNHKIQNLEYEYKKVRRALEFLMPAMQEKLDNQDFMDRMLEKRKKQAMIPPKRECKPLGSSQDVSYFELYQ